MAAYGDFKNLFILFLILFMFIFYYISFVMIFYLYSFMRRETWVHLYARRRQQYIEIAWQTCF